MRANAQEIEARRLDKLFINFSAVPVLGDIAGGVFERAQKIPF